MLNKNKKLDKLKDSIDNNLINTSLIDIKNKDPKYLTENNENGSSTDDGSPTDVEINSKKLEHEFIESECSNYENTNNYFDKIENNMNPDEVLEVSVDEDKTYVIEEIKHSYNDVVFYSELKKNSTENINDEETRELINEFNNLKLYDPKIDILFKTIFKHEDLILSLLNSILPEEEEIINFKISSEEVIFIPNISNKREKIVADLYLKGLSKKNNNDNYDDSQFVIEMQIKKKEDIILRARITIIEIVLNNLSDSGKFQYKGRICSFNFIYYNLEEKKNDPSYIHKINDYENDENKFEIYVVELKKFKDQFNLSKLKELADKVYGKNNEKSNIKFKKELKKHLWLTFLSKINVNYGKKNKELLSKYENYGKEELKEVKGQKYKIYIRNEIDPFTYKLFKMDVHIMKALDHCKKQMSEENANKYYKFVTTEEENDELKEQIKKKDEQIKDKDEQIKDKDEQIKDKDEQIVNISKENEELKNIINQKNNGNEYMRIVFEQIKNLSEEMKFMNEKNKESNNIVNMKNNNGGEKFMSEQINIIHEQINTLNKENKELKNMMNMQSNMINMQNNKINNLINTNIQMFEQIKELLKRKHNETDEREDDESLKKMKFK